MGIWLIELKILGLKTGYNQGSLVQTTFENPDSLSATVIKAMPPIVQKALAVKHYVRMALWCTLGDYLEGSGWTSALTQADVASPAGTVDGLIPKSCAPYQN